MKSISCFFCAILILIITNTSAQSTALSFAKSMGGNSDDYGVAIAVDLSGNIYTAGTFADTVDFDPGAGIYNLVGGGNYNSYISKLDATGNFIWAKGPIGSTCRVMAIEVDAFGNVYTTGSFGGVVDFDPGPSTFSLVAANNAEDIFILKLDPSGNFVWAKSMQGISFSTGRALAIDPSGNVYTTGMFRETTDFDPGPGSFTLTTLVPNSDIFVSKLDASGNFVWAKGMGAAGSSNKVDVGKSIALDISGNVYTAGNFGSIGDFDPGPGTFTMDAATGSGFISKLDASGNFVWAINMAGSQGLVQALALDGSGNIYSTGSYSGTSEFDPGTATFNLTSTDANDIFVLKLDMNANFIWAKSMGGAGSDVGTSIDTDASGNVFSVGFFSGNADFDPGMATYTLPAGIFISKLSNSGNFVWAKSLGGLNQIQCNSIKVDPSGNIYATGSFSGTADFDPESGITNLSSKNKYDIYVQKLGQTTAGIENAYIENRIAIYPNPGNGLYTFKTPLEFADNVLEIYNSLGALVLTRKISNEQPILNLSDLDNGVYYIKNSHRIFKIIKNGD